MIIAQGGRFGGWALYVKDGHAKFVYNVLGMQEFVTAATEPLPAGSHQVRAEFAYDGGGLAKGGDVTLYYDGRAVGSGRVDLTQPLIFSADETTDIGDDYGMPVSADYAARASSTAASTSSDRRRRRRPLPPDRSRGGRAGRHLPPVGRDAATIDRRPAGRRSPSGASMRKTYHGDAIEVSFDLDRCIHVGECLLSLPEVFDLQRRPWIDPDSTMPTRLARPSSVVRAAPCNTGGSTGATGSRTVDGLVLPMRNGPLRVVGEIRVRLEDGTEEVLPRATLCRCGGSARKPFCDNTHLKIGFQAPGELFKIRLSPVRPDATIRCPPRTIPGAPPEQRAMSSVPDR